jgi:hypothetical protein
VNLQLHKDLTESLARFAITNRSSDITLHIIDKLSAHALKRKQLLEQLDIEEEAARDKKYWYVMEWLASWRAAEDKSTREQLADHESFCEVRKHNPGSGDWIVQNEILNSWMEDDTPTHPALWLNGIPGAGEWLMPRV